MGCHNPAYVTQNIHIFILKSQINSLKNTLNIDVLQTVVTIEMLIPVLDMLYKLRVEEGEAGELVLVEVHHEQLVRGRQDGVLLREARVKV